MSAESTKNLGSNGLDKNPFIRGKQYVAQAGPSGIVRLAVPSKPRGVMLLEAPFPVQLSLGAYRNGYTQIRVTRVPEFLERIQITGAAVSNVDFDVSLDGDIDHEYILEGYWVSSSTLTPELRWRVNGDTSENLSNEGTTRLGWSPSGTSSSSSAGLVIAQSSFSTDTEHHLIAYLQGATGQGNRLGRSLEGQTYLTTSANQIAASFVCKWEDSTTKIKSLGLTFEDTDGQVGSYFDLYRKPVLNKTPLKIWVY